MPVYNGQIVYTNLKKGVTNMTYGDDEVYSFDNLIGNGKMLITRKDNERNYLVDKEGKTERLPIKGKIELLPENVKHSNDIVLVESDEENVMKLRRIDGEPVKCNIDIFSISVDYHSSVTSEYVDVDKIVELIGLNGNGIRGLRMDNSVPQVLDRLGYTSKNAKDYVSNDDIEYLILPMYEDCNPCHINTFVCYSDPYIISGDSGYQFGNIQPKLLETYITIATEYGDDFSDKYSILFEALKRKAQQFGTIDGYSYNDDVMNSITYVTKDRRYAYNISWKTESNGVEIAFGYIDYVPHGQGLSIKARKPTQSEEDYNYDEFSNNDY